LGRRRGNSQKLEKRGERVANHGEKKRKRRILISISGGRGEEELRRLNRKKRTANRGKKGKEGCNPLTTVEEGEKGERRNPIPVRQMVYRYEKIKREEKSPGISRQSRRNIKSSISIQEGTRPDRCRKRED